MEEVTVSDYNRDWMLDFKHEKEKLIFTLKDVIQGIEHIGSTAVPGLSAKPLIDMMIGVSDIEGVTETHKELLAAIGYEYVYHSHFPERRFFRKGLWRAGTHHLHIYKYESDHWHSNLLFRNYLINHREVASEYNDLKLELEERFKTDRVKYTEAKGPFIESTIRKAKLEIERNPENIIFKKRRIEYE
ncbi:GrpB family protein [Paenibacillus glacialis]|uniref:Glutamate-rich protein GrpB n=1 Tax=Paenibacillus glacialis TaxID=494026 RepID=A0A168HP13_9BACL|nr:GrpB family protein [Paenibacillus glacialis]OAB38382.1 hypothetical protein PGLA_20000 [Paenibacillus glacialis]